MIAWKLNQKGLATLLTICNPAHPLSDRSRMASPESISLQAETDLTKLAGVVGTFVWGDSDASGIEVKDTSGLGGGKVYFVTKTGATPEKVKKGVRRQPTAAVLLLSEYPAYTMPAIWFFSLQCCFGLSR